MLTAENSLALAIDFQARMMPAIYKHEELARRSAIFIEGCRILGVPIITTQQYTQGLGETIAEIKEALKEFVPIEKITFSCCNNKEFKENLIRAGKKNICVSKRFVVILMVSPPVVICFHAGYIRGFYGK